MNGKETKAERERCQIWDAIFTHGPADIPELAERTELGRARVAELTSHEWFRLMDGLIYISIITASGKNGIRLAKAKAA